MKRRVVVTGLGAVCPVGNDVNSMWAAMLEGKNGIGPITLFDTTLSRVKIAAEVKNFDASKYLDERQIARLDRTILLGLVAASQAYEDADLASVTIDRYRIGTFVTSGMGGSTTIWTESQHAAAKGPDRMSPYFIPNSIVNLVGGNITIKFNIKGPNLPVVTACSSSTNSIGEAYRYIKDGYLEIALAGGAEAAINPLGISGFTVLRALNFSNDPARASIPFDRERTGFVLGEGAGVLVLEEYEHALARHANIYAEVVGYGNTSDAYHITAPDETGESITMCLNFALEEAGIKPEQVDYINAHGTSTVLNDRIETRAIKQAFGPHAYKLNISSTKSMTGHMLGATGAIESIAAILSIRDGIIPPTINTRETDADCDLNYTLGQAVKRRVDISMNINMGFGGQNAAIVFKKVSK
ncbi:MAG TPA: beta-ketoacyl-[acyl-carrier-protein] synthase II [Firmicutes bacterium]|jgi:3-oxoacyl-[acyl-carrier-protein] synthase II|nr:beta-ketoacyl-[acyl-carrier-protein] synthase II [Bacillota bacterium]